MMTTVDVSGYLKKLSMPTLIMHGRDDTIVPFALGRNLAASLPEAKFVPFDDSVAAPWRKQERITSAIRRFLGIEIESKPKPAPGRGRRLYDPIHGHRVLHGTHPAFGRRQGAGGGPRAQPDRA
ncbi:MAG: hypothetical protein IIB22_06430 [Chloroflexi bacterium]|nr:hypothetical protein [Chloroflexota bacterium]